MKITKLEWDTNFFGFPVGRINEKQINSIEELDAVIKEAKDSSYRLCYFMIPKNNCLSDDLINLHKGFLADEKVTYSINEINKIDLLDLTNIGEFNDHTHLEEMYRLAIQSSYKSRFRFDKNFEPEFCDKMYKLWIDNSISGQLAEKIFVYKENDVITGMVTVYTGNNTGNIGLIGVDSSERGKNIGKKLIHKTFDYLISNNILKVDVNTQLRNIEACRFYEKCGFSVSKIINIYHFWL